MVAGDLLKVGYAGVSADAFRASFLDVVSKRGSTTVQTFLRDYSIPKSLVKYVLDELKIEASCCLSNIAAKERSLLVNLFCEYPFVVDHLGGFKVAMATAGGISLKEVSLCCYYPYGYLHVRVFGGVYWRMLVSDHRLYWRWL